VKDFDPVPIATLLVDVPINFAALAAAALSDAAAALSLAAAASSESLAATADAAAAIALAAAASSELPAAVSLAAAAAALAAAAASESEILSISSSPVCPLLTFAIAARLNLSPCS
jgi:hypothetical protein